MQSILPLEQLAGSRETFDYFYTSDANRLCIESLKAALGKEGFACHVIWGASGAGKSHVLHALCDAAHNHGLSYQCLTPDTVQALSGDALDVDVLCLDTVELMLHDQLVCERLFHGYQRAMMRDALWVLASSASPFHLHCALDDLLSRIRHGLIHQLHPLGEADLKQAIMLELKRLGLRYQDGALDYFMIHVGTHPTHVFEALAKLNARAWQRQRALTVPLIREYLQQT